MNSCIHIWQDSLDEELARPIAATYTRKNKQNKRRQTYHASNGIRTHDPSVRAGENITCVTLSGHCEQPHQHTARPVKLTRS
jgi:hypothetical protein